MDEKDVERFYKDWHEELRRWGVDWFKVDDQVSFIEFFLLGCLVFVCEVCPADLGCRM